MPQYQQWPELDSRHKGQTPSSNRPTATAESLAVMVTETFPQLSIKPTLSDIERALDTSKLLVRSASGRLWRARRNGKTQLWQRTPGKFRIPVKAGLRVYRACGEITEATIVAYDLSVDRDLADFIIEIQQ